MSRAVSPFFRLDVFDFTLTVEAPPPRICFSASSHEAEPLSISYLEARNQLLFIRDSLYVMGRGRSGHSLVERKSIDQGALLLAELVVDLLTPFAEFLI